MADSTRLQTLFNRYLQASATEAEIEEMLLLGASPEHEAEFRALLSVSWDEVEKITDAISEKPEAGSAKILQFSHPVNSKTAKRFSIRIGLVAKYSGVAALVVLFILLANFLREGKTHAPADRVALTQEFAPGKKGAVLTLSNGSKVLLDSTRSGRLAIQGKTSVIRSANGSLSYAGETESAAPILNTVSTPRGRHYEFTLPDGTKVWMNAASSLTYPVTFANDSRNVELSGEAYFEVAKNPQKPFRIQLPGCHIQVTGTSFNVSSYQDKKTQRITLVEGGLLLTTTRSSVRMKAGDETGIYHSTGAMLKTADANIELALAWKNGLFHFENADIREVLSELERWYDVDVEYRGEVKPQAIYGKMQRELYLSQVLNILRKLGVNFQIEHNRLVVKS